MRQVRARSVLSGLADVGFRRCITPRLVSWVYVAIVAAVTAWALAAVAIVGGIAAWLGPGWWVVAPVVVGVAVVVLLLARVACEWVLMVFARGHTLAEDARRKAAREAVDEATKTDGGLPGRDGGA